MLEHIGELVALIIPPEGGATEFASTRCAYPSLPEDMKRRVATAIAIHDFSWSRDQIKPGFFTAEERATYPPVRHPLVRTNPVNGRREIRENSPPSVVRFPIPTCRPSLSRRRRA